MSGIEILSVVATVITIGSFCVMTVRWFRLRLNSPAFVQAYTKIPLWDIAFVSKEDTPSEIVVARLTVAGETGIEAGYRAKQLVEQWNQVSHGFEILSGKTIPNDDEGKPLGIIRPDLLPQFDGDSRAITASMSKRESHEFPGVVLCKKLFRKKSERTS